MSRALLKHSLIAMALVGAVAVCWVFMTSLDPEPTSFDRIFPRYESAPSNQDVKSVVSVEERIGKFRSLYCFQ